MQPQPENFPQIDEPMILLEEVKNMQVYIDLRFKILNDFLSMNFLNFQIRQVVEISPKIILENEPIVVDENLQVENVENLPVETRTKKVQKTQKYDMVANKIGNFYQPK